MALQAQELAPSGIMFIILSLKASIYSKFLNFWHLKESGHALKTT